VKSYQFYQASFLWRVASYGVAGLVLLPILTVFAAWALPVADHWDHIVSTMLTRLISNSVKLVIGVLIGTAVLGVVLAWFVTQYRFPGQVFFRKALLLPLAIPAYVTGFVYVGLLDYAGPLPTLIRDLTDSRVELPDIRSTVGVIGILSLTLYPYVFLIVKNAFESQGRHMIEAGRSLGHSMPQIFFRLAIPMALPWLLGALSLVGMETLADFGTVSIFVYDTFTTAIYKAWYGFFSPTTAAQLASLLLVPIACFYVIEQWIKKRQRYATGLTRQVEKLSLSGWRKWAVSSLCGLVFTLGFVVPAGQLLIWSGQQLATIEFGELVELSWHSGLLGVMTAVTVLLGALIVIFSYRFFQLPRLHVANRVASLGYALPGSVLAIGLYLPMMGIDQTVAGLMQSWFGWEAGLWLTGSLAIMVIGLSIRFMAVAHAVLYAGQQRISGRLDEAAANHGFYGIRQLWNVHLPLLKKPIITAFILVFVDVIKEMPLTLMTRPFGWNTLSVRIFEFISEGEWQRAAVPGLIMIIISTIPVLVMDREDT
jgi:iron(III) transport system permease protein